MTSQGLATEPMLRRGDRGEDVHRLQSLLAGVLRPDPAADGIFGPGTESAVEAFQDMVGLQVDGIVGPRTWERLLAEYHRLNPLEFEGDVVEVERPAPPTHEQSEEGCRLLERLMDAAAEEFLAFAEVHNEWVHYDGSEEGKAAFLESAKEILSSRGSRWGFVKAGATWMESFLRNWVAANEAGQIAALETEYFDAMSRGLLAGLHGEPAPQRPRNEVLAAALEGAHASASELAARDRRNILACLSRKGDPGVVLHEPGLQLTHQEWAAALRSRGYQSDGLYRVFLDARDRH